MNDNNKKRLSMTTKRTILSTTFTADEVKVFWRLMSLLDKVPDASIMLRSEPVKSLRQKFIKLSKKSDGR